MFWRLDDSQWIQISLIASILPISPCKCTYYIQLICSVQILKKITIMVIPYFNMCHRFTLPLEDRVQLSRPSLSLLFIVSSSSSCFIQTNNFLLSCFLRLVSLLQIPIIMESFYYLFASPIISYKNYTHPWGPVQWSMSTPLPLFSSRAPCVLKSHL